VTDRAAPGIRPRDGARAAAPLALAVLAFGATFGVLAEAAGLGGLAAVVMSATTFAGSAQFAAASVLSAGGTVAAAVSAALLLNGRYVPIALSVAPELRGGPVARFLQAQLAVDEAWAISHRGGGVYDVRLLVGAGLTLYAAWLGGTAVGVLGGDLLGDPERLGLDAAFPALFLALLAGQLREPRAALAAVLGATVALALVPLTPAGIPIVAAAAGCLVGLRRAPEGGRGSADAREAAEGHRP
jgi:4-azaleucine resistance transporter AzlC